MNEYEIALLIGALFTAIIARSLPRARLWIAAGALSFAASSAWWKFGLPHHAAFTLACDAAICLSVYSFAREEWELRIYDVFRLSVLFSLLKLMGVIDSNSVYAATLELCNWIALLLVGSTALLAGVADAGHSFGSWFGNLRRVGLSGRAARRAPRWFDVPR